jgi:hypothetical protein
MSQHKLNFAASRLVNPPGAAPVLTEAQVLAGLELKVRAPQDFVPAIISCDLISDTGDKVGLLSSLRCCVLI